MKKYQTLLRPLALASLFACVIIAYSSQAAVAMAAEDGKYAELRNEIPFVTPSSPIITCFISYGIQPFLAGPIDDAMGSSLIRQDRNALAVPELMLAFGWRNPRASDYWHTLEKDRMSFFTDKEKRTAKEWVVPCFDPVESVLRLWWQVHTKEGYDATTLGELLDRTPFGNACSDRDGRYIVDYLDMYTSPVTGRLLEFNHAEFSPGNMYLKIVPNDIVAANRDFLGGFWSTEPIVREEPKDIVYIFYRVYGTEGVIRSGLLWGLPSGRVMGRT